MSSVKQSSATSGDVILVTSAGEKDSHRIVSDLLRGRYRIVVTSRHASRLVGILHGHSSERLMAVVADTSDRRQVAQLAQSVERRFGRGIDTVVCAGTNGQHTGCCRLDVWAVLRQRAGGNDALFPLSTVGGPGWWGCLR